jgi:hypothetical protein
MYKPRILSEILLSGVSATGSASTTLAGTAKQANQWNVNLPRPKEVVVIRRATGYRRGLGKRVEKTITRRVSGCAVGWTLTLTKKEFCGIAKLTD